MRSKTDATTITATDTSNSPLSPTSTLLFHHDITAMDDGVKHQVTYRPFIVQELCESRGGRPGLSVLTSLLVSVDVKIY